MKGNRSLQGTDTWCVLEGLVGLREGRAWEKCLWGSCTYARAPMSGNGRSGKRPGLGVVTMGSYVPRRRASPAVPHPARGDRASSSRERSTSRGRGATRSSSRESGRGGRGRGRPVRTSPSPSPSGLCQLCPARGRRGNELAWWRHDPVTPASSLHTSPPHPRWSLAPF